MPKYLIERIIPDAGKLSQGDLEAISRKSNDVLEQMKREGKNIQWIQSYVSDAAIQCVYIASDQETVREHARRGGFPADKISEVRGVIDPTTGE
ncbi:MAG: DUF4242 domain-containing protein [Dehalococcoidia bacterium]